MLGIQGCEELNTLNTLILIGKGTIHQEKQNNKQPTLYQFHLRIKEYIRYEKAIYAIDDISSDRLEKKWGQLWHI